MLRASQTKFFSLVLKWNGGRNQISKTLATKTVFSRNLEKLTLHCLLLLF